MVYDAIIIVAQARMQDQQMAAARRALLDEAFENGAARGMLATRIGRLFVALGEVALGERIEGVRYTPVTTLSPRHSPR